MGYKGESLDSGWCVDGFVYYSIRPQPKPAKKLVQRQPPDFVCLLLLGMFITGYWMVSPKRWFGALHEMVLEAGDWVVGVLWEFFEGLPFTADMVAALEVGIERPFDNGFRGF